MIEQLNRLPIDDIQKLASSTSNQYLSTNCKLSSNNEKISKNNKIDNNNTIDDLTIHSIIRKEKFNKMELIDYFVVGFP
ncbi:hypothetical protein SLH04_001215, partial [Campylobacter coli]|nr:hypothetical protein [Campylobacter coli]